MKRKYQGIELKLNQFMETKNIHDNLMERGQGENYKLG